MFASVIIPTHNRRDSIERAVRSLAVQTYPQDRFEIIVSCDRCTDGTEDRIASTFGDRAKVVRATVPGQTGALNAGIRIARGELGIFLDDDMEAVPHFVAAHVEAHERNGNAKIVLVGRVRPTFVAPPAPWMHGLVQDLEALQAAMQEPGRRNTPRDLIGGNFSVRLPQFRQLGGYNETYRFAFNDFELATRLLENGYTILFDPQAEAKTRYELTSEQLIHRATERAGNELRLAREHPWCVPYLPMHSVFSCPGRRRRWRLLWNAPWLALAALRAARRFSPDNVRFVYWEFATRYCLALRQQVPAWSQLCRAFQAPMPYPVQTEGCHAIRR